MGTVKRPEWADTFKAVAKVESVNCARNSSDNFGAIASASITITAPARTEILQHGFSKHTDGPLGRYPGLADGVFKDTRLDLKPNRNPKEDSSPFLGEVIYLLIAVLPGDKFSEALILKKSAKSGFYERIYLGLV